MIKRLAALLRPKPPATQFGRPLYSETTAVPQRAAGRWRQPAGPLSLFAPAYVTRNGSREPLARDMLFAAVDIETTGLDPKTHRICEIAIVRFRGDGRIESEYSTLVNPQRRMAASDIHRITDQDVADAPTFAQIAHDVAHYLSGAVVVAHNLAFEDKFLRAEFRRVGFKPPRWPGLCTMVAARAQLDGPAYTLGTVYRSVVGDWLESHHLALADARGSAHVLTHIIKSAPNVLHYFGPEPVASPRRAPAWRIAARTTTAGPAESVLASMASRLPRTDGTHPKHPTRGDTYASTLATLLEGGKIKRTAAAELEVLVRNAGLDQTEVNRLNALAWNRVLSSAGEPSTLNQRRIKALADAATSLGLTQDAERFRQLSAGTAAGSPSGSGALKGWRIGLVPGSPEAEDAAQFALAHGASLAKRLTGTVRMVIADTPKSGHPQLATARELGLRILTPAQADLELKALVKTAVAAQNAKQAQRTQQNRESPATWTHRWRPREDNPAWGFGKDLVQVRLK